MAEVRKRVLEDKYNTESIKTSIKKKEENKKTNKKDKKNVKKTKKEEKKGFFRGIASFLGEVKAEFHKVHWPEKKDMVKNSIATIVFILFFSSFFYIINILFAFVQSLF